MDKIINFLKEAGIYFLATMDGDKPRVRPFGTIHVIDGKLCIQTGKKKDVSKQIHANPNVEISACNKTGDKWIRLSGVLKEDERIEAKKSMLDAYPELRSMYNENDGNTEIFYFESGKCTFCSFVSELETIEF